MNTSLAASGPVYFLNGGRGGGGDRVEVAPDAGPGVLAWVGAQTIEVDASHSIALSLPEAVADLIRTEAKATNAVAV